MFADEAELVVRSGKGGDGLVSFRREKYVPYGGPDGGDGGRGGDVVLKARRNLRTLSHIRSRHYFKGEPGQNGGKQNKTGRNGSPCMIEVPLGTIVKLKETGDIIGDLSKDNEELVVARGGRGGKGNSHFVSSTNQAPKYAQEGENGEEKELFLELKLIADIGLVGFPNAGKSTLLSRLSKANPKIGDYPFTTLYPNLGVVYPGNYDSYIVADIPGLIEGAHRGVGLGIRFLKHIERTKGLLFMIDLFEEKPFLQFELLMKELESYHPDIIKKPYYIALNKIDLFTPENREKKKNEFLSYYNGENRLLMISAVTGEGIEDLKKTLLHLISTVTD